MKIRHLSKLSGMSEKDICGILNLADQLKFEKENKIPHRLSEPCVAGIIGTLPQHAISALQIAAYELGACAVKLPDNMEAAVASKYAACIVAAFKDENEFSAFSEKSEVPVMAVFPEGESVLEELSALMTARENSGSFENKQGGVSEAAKAENILHVTKAVLATALKSN